MKCPFCQSDNDRVIDSRAHQEGAAIRRRRECLNCKRRYTTYERADQSPIKIVKKDGVRVPFERERLRQGLEKACWKRPVSVEQIDEVVTSIENHIHDLMEPEVESRTLGELAMAHLRRLDQVAYVRFASVYREFKDVHDFVHELQPMLLESPPQGS